MKLTPEQAAGKGVALITGIRGFVGRYLAPELERGNYVVHGTAISPQHCDQTVFQCDMTDRRAVIDVVERVSPDIVAHLAAISFVPHQDIDAMYRVNVTGTIHLLEALASCSKRPRMVLLSSSANVYGNVAIRFVDEGTCPAPLSHYAVSKLSMEYAAALYGESLPIVVARAFNFIGVGQAEHFLVPKLVSHFKSRAPEIALGNIDVVRDFTDVRDGVGIYRRLLESNLAGQTINVCSGIERSVKDILNMLSRLSRCEITVRTDPNLVRRNEVPALVGSNDKLYRLTGLRPTTALSNTLQWMLDDKSPAE